MKYEKENNCIWNSLSNPDFRNHFYDEKFRKSFNDFKHVIAGYDNSINLDNCIFDF